MKRSARHLLALLSVQYFISLAASCQCDPTVTLTINGRENNVVVSPGEILRLNFSYRISNDKTGPTVINQIMWGYDNDRYADCIYTGIPSVCPTLLTSSKAFQTRAPANPGIYHIYYCTTMDYGCKPALFKSDHLVGTVTVIAAISQQQANTITECKNNVSLNINNQGSNVSVAPGSNVQLHFDYNISNSPSSPTAINQVLIGYDNNQYLGCVYNSVPAVCPANTYYKGTLQIKAPVQPGTYKIFYNVSMDYSCKPSNYRSQNLVGSLTVNAQQAPETDKVSCTYQVSMTLNDQRDSITVNPGERVKLNFSYSIFDPAGCPNCIKQIMFGFRGQYLGCIYSGTPPICPDTKSGTYSQFLVAPSAPGRYAIYYNILGSNDFTCKPDSFFIKSRIGVLIVGGPGYVYNQKKPEENTRTDKSLIQAQQNTANNVIGPAKYYALIIGESNYQEDRLNLDRPEKDAQAFHDVLVSHYTFNDSNIIMMLSPTREKILSQLFKYRKIITHNDNFLIFYAGHGYYDKDADQGYWWPSDAKHDNPANWLSNSDLKDEIKSIGSQHTLLISDACFSGGIFKVRDVSQLMNAPNDIKQLYSMPSRRAMTSGTLTVVPDNSVFLEYLNKNLSQNTSKYLSSQELFYKMLSAVIGNSTVVPQTGVIYGSGDEGGDFIFILKN